MIRCTVVKLAYAFKDCRKVEQFLFECQLTKDTYWYVGSALGYSCDDHINVILYSKEWIACLMPYDTPCDLDREHNS